MDIFETQKYVWELDKLKAQYYSFFENEKRRSTTRNLIIGVCLFALYLAFTTIIFWGENPLIILVILLSAIIVPIIVNHVKKKSITRDPAPKEIAAVRKKHGNEISNLETKMRGIEAILEKSVLPAKYHYSFAVNWMVDAILSKRADTLKEVLNLYEDYLQK